MNNRNKRQAFKHYEPFNLDDTAIRLPLFEPAGQSIDLSLRELCGHTLMIGQTGCGKTSILNQYLSQLIAFNNNDFTRKIGLLILDFQGDDTISRVRQLAEENGRGNDVQVLSVDEGYYDPFAWVKTISDCEDASQRLIMSSFEIQSRENEFWERGTIRIMSNFILSYFLYSDKLSLIPFLSYADSLTYCAPQEIAKLTVKFTEFCSQLLPHIPETYKSNFETIGTGIKSWATLDFRTRSIFQACLGNCLNPLMQFNARSYFDPQKNQLVEIRKVFERGSIVVVSLPSIQNPDLAKLLGRLIKMEFYALAMGRSNNLAQRPVGFICDEYPLIATAGSSRFSDVTALANLRSRNTFMVAAAQGLANLNIQIGEKYLSALMANFSNITFFRSYEPITSKYAKHLISYPPPQQNQHIEPDRYAETIMDEIQSIHSPQRPVLAHLEDFQAYLKIGPRVLKQQPFWLGSKHFECVRNIESTPYNSGNIDQILSNVRGLYKSLKKRGLTSEPTLSETDFKYVSERIDNNLILLHSRSDFYAYVHSETSVKPSVIRTLPRCWELAAMRMIQEAKCHNIEITELKCDAGSPHIKVKFHAFPNKQSVRFSAKWKRSFYPSNLRPLKHKHTLPYTAFPF